ncbi:hypothetical protein N3K66_004764 [Trichothecium roseum]|uniref:Uncharacterized protein n=1 Tax=Trichothecium roseum TaxID=47278 RepID=A0ACC0V2A9_9HYPO|nr:hypothetical protein N3K66_004764 [Trichothecium roseum]
MSNHKAIESLLCRVASQVLKKDESEIDAGKSFAAQGGDTLQAIFFAAQCREVGVIVDMMDVSLCGSLVDLAQKLAPTHAHLQVSEATVNGGQQQQQQQEQEKGKERVKIPFTELQSLYGSAGVNQTLLWDVGTATMSESDVTTMLEQVVERHPVLGASFDTESRQVVTGGAAASPSGILVPYESDEECASRVEKLRTEVSKSEVDVLHVLNVLLFGETSQIKKIGLVVPAGALDAQSWHTLIQDLQTYSIRATQPTAQVHTFANWVETTKEEKGMEKGHQNELVQEPLTDSKPPLQTPHAASDVSSSTFTLSTELTDSLYDEKCHQTLRTEVHDLLFASLASSFKDQLPDTTGYLEIRDGRPQDDGDAWDTVIGCFDELVDVPYHSSGDVLNASRSAKDARKRSVLRSVPSGSDHQHFIFDTTELRRRRTSGDSSFQHSAEQVSRKDIGERLVQSLGGLYVLPFWAGMGLSFLVMCGTKSGGEAGPQVSSEAFIRHLSDTVAKLTDSIPLPTLLDFPYISLDYPSLDRLFEQKLRRIAEEPLTVIENIYPCSPIQENVLVSSSLDKGAYTCIFTVKVSTSGRFASCDAEKWVAAWGKVVDKHSALRTIFVESEGRQGHFDQIVLHKVTPRVDIVNGTAPPLDVEFRPLEAPHHLSIGEAGTGQFIIVLTISHAITDGHSAEVILSDMCGYVAGMGSSSGGDKKVLSYSDYVIDQHQPLTGMTVASDYWPRYLEKTQETLLPVTRDVDELSGFDTVKSVIPINVKSVDRLCQQHNINLSSVCQFAWGVVLRSHLGVDDVCFSYISSVRHVPLKGIMTAVGPLITTLLCSMNLDGDANVLDAVKAVNADYLESLAHEAELADAVSTRRWSNTVMSFRRRLVSDDESLPGLKCKIIKGLSPTNYDVSLIVSAGQADMEVNLDYWSSRMDSEYALRLVQNFQEALYSIFRDISTTISELELVSDEQKQWILEKNASVPKGLNACVHEPINDRIRKQPAALAVEAWDGSLTYGELDQSASRLSQRLVDMGIRPEVPVALCMDKSKLVPVAMLAILRAGGAVVPIGVMEPTARVEVILADSRPAVVICDNKQFERFSGVGSSAQILSTDDIGIKVRGQRLDVAEVEHWITKLLDGVRRAVVGLMPVASGEDATAAKGGFLYAAVEFSEDTGFIALGDEDILSASEEIREVLNHLRDTLQARLPSYMIPTFYVPFRRVPLTSSGKTDRKMVRRLVSELSMTDLESYVSDEDSANNGQELSETAQTLQGLWASVLGVSSTSIKAGDHFLYRGGDSVSAIKLVEAARLEHLNLTVLDVLSFPRLQDLARVVDERRAEAEREDSAHGRGADDPVPFSLWEPSSDDKEAELADLASQCGLGPEEIEDVYPCTPLQQSMLAATQQRPTAYLVRRVYSLANGVDLERFHGAWKAMIDRAPLMRTRILLGQRSGSLQILSKEAPAWLHHDSLDRYVAEDQARVMAVGQPLMRFALVQEAVGGARYFVWTAHHSVYDGWSAQLIYRWLAALYLRDEMPPAVPFTRFIEHLQGGDLRDDQAAAFWRRQLEGEVPSAFPSMPSSYYQPKPTSVLTSEIDTSVTGSHRAGSSLANVLRAAWAMTLSQNIVPDLHAATDIKHVLIIEPSSTGKEDAHRVPGMDLVDTAVDAFDTFALTLQCHLPSENGGPLKVEARFDSHVVAEPQVEVLLRQLQHWVSQFLDPVNRDKHLHALEAVTSTDLAEIKTRNADTPVRDMTCLHHLVRSVVCSQPASPAICAWDGDFTYQELQSHARTLGHYLSSLGVGPEVRVGLCMDKSKWTVVSMLAILESGGVVVLLGTQYPVDRLQAIIQDCGARVILTNAAHTERLSGSGPSIVGVDETLLASIPAPGQEVTEICPELQPHHPAWIVYTSGSTGSPKGSLLIHGGMATSLPAHGRPTKWSSESRTLQFSAHTFDVAIQEIMTTLIFGGCVCIPSEDQRINSLSQCITAMNVNTIVLTSTVASTVNPEDVPSVTQLQLVGEQAKPSVVERWLGRAEIINIYGPSECSVYSSCSLPMQKLEDAPNIGFPLDACNFWITSTTDYNRLVPIGVPGELLIENAWQAQEYVNNPELTARSFVAEPGFVKQLGLHGKGRRMYRTGDLVRQNPDGSYTHLGRIDTQVKFRGHRVDLGEIEYWIGKLLNGVRTAVVDLVDLQAGKGAGDLVAVMDFAPSCDLFGSEEPETEDVDGVTILAPSMKIQKALVDLKDILGEKLPSYMVPTAYLPWQKIPLNPSGKTNRYAVRQFLTSLDSGTSLFKRYLADEGVKQGPETEMGKQLQRLWAEVLSVEVDSIGAQDHFTRLGGDSLAAMKLVTAGRQVGLHLTVSSIFTYPILADFARVLEEEQQVGRGGSAEEDPAPFELALESETAIASPGFQSRLQDMAVQCRLYLEMDQVIGFEPGQPLLRCGLIRDQSSANTKSYFVLTTHHTMFDKWSLQRVYTRYLYPAYAGLEMPKVVPYPRFIRYVSDTDMDAASQYWNKLLADGDSFTDFPSLTSASFFQPNPTSLLERTVGVSKIKKLVPTFAPADLGHLFLVHPAEDANDLSLRVPGFEQVRVGMEAALDNYPLTILCKVDERGTEATIEARFDSAVIGDDRLSSILRQFEHNVAQLSNATNQEQTVGSLQLANSQDLDQLSKWNLDLDVQETPLGCVHDLVKIRGQRVDLAEVEFWILRLVPALRTAVVEYFSPNDRQRALVAAVEFHDREDDGRDFSSVSTRLKTSLSEKLPSYMVPRVYLQMDKVPKTASGKTDRRSVRRFMAAESFQRADKLLADNTSEPGTVHGDREVLVRKLWASVIGLEQESIDRQDNFFDLGADSIGAMKLVAAAKLEGLGLQVVDVFKSPVLCKLAAVARDLGVSATKGASKQQYQPFQLLGSVGDIDNFLEEVVYPATGTQRDSVIDAFPATDAVAFNVAGALTSAQTEVNTFALDTDSHLDPARLQQSCFLLAQHVEAFRTVFVINHHDGKFLQVILKSHEYNVPVVVADGSMESATKQLMDGGMSRRFRLGRPMMDMAILHHQETSKTRVLFRMSHALYDGLSLPIMWDTLRALYQTQGPIETPLSSFSAYVHDLISHTGDTAYSYWRALLDGSVMPELSAATRSDDQTPRPMAFTHSKQVPVSKLRGQGITTSAVLNCAWAHVLAQYTGTDDVVFGDTISGRNLVDPSISNTLVGCCATHVPMRVRFDGPGRQTVLDLLHQVRDQQHGRIPHEGLGFRTVIRDCTDWAPSTRFTSIVNHRPGRPAASSKPGGAAEEIRLSFGTVTTEKQPLTTWYDLAVISEEGDGVTSLSLGYSTTAFEPETAQALLDDLAETASIMMDVGAPGSDHQLVLHGTEAMPKSSSSVFAGMTADGAADTLDRIWFSVFASERGRREEEEEEEDVRRKPFTQIGGNILGAAHLVALVERARTTASPLSNAGAGAEVTVDDVLRHPSLAEFAGFLRRRSIHLD